MSLPGTFIQAALHEQTIFALNPDVAESVSQHVLKWEQTAHLYLDSLFGFTWGDSLSWWIVNWFQNWIRYVPDKTMSAAIALVVLKYGYPLFERELIHGGPEVSVRTMSAFCLWCWGCSMPLPSLPCSAVKRTEARPTGLCGLCLGC